VSSTGMAGFINAPWAGVMEDRHVEMGYRHIPKAQAWDRPVYTNEIYYAALGLLPRLEVGLRFTRTPGLQTFGDIDPQSQLTTDTDHMASARVNLVPPRVGRPGVSIGVEDVQGTRRFHSSYLVTGLPFAINSVQSRVTLGYAGRVFTATRRVLDGGFGAFEVSPWRVVATKIEYDSEKWNLGLGVDLGYGLRLHAAALNMESVSVGAGWFHKL